jgi:hypothetical protein
VTKPKPKAKKTTPRKPRKKANQTFKQVIADIESRQNRERETVSVTTNPPKWRYVAVAIPAILYTAFVIVSVIAGANAPDSENNNDSNNEIRTPSISNEIVIPETQPNYDSDIERYQSDFDRYAEEQYKELTDEPYFVDNSDSYSNENFGR